MLWSKQKVCAFAVLLPFRLPASVSIFWFGVKVFLQDLTIASNSSGPSHVADNH
jgi:hypothetical protein